MSIQLSGSRAVSFLLLTSAALFLFLSFESPFWAEVRTGCRDTRMSIGIWRYIHLAVDLPSEISNSALHGADTEWYPNFQACASASAGLLVFAMAAAITADNMRGTCRLWKWFSFLLHAATVGFMITTASMFYTQYTKLHPRVDGETAAEFELSTAFQYYICALVLTSAAAACTTFTDLKTGGLATCGVQTNAVEPVQETPPEEQAAIPPAESESKTQTKAASESSKRSKSPGKRSKSPEKRSKSPGKRSKSPGEKKKKKGKK